MKLEINKPMLLFELRVASILVAALMTVLAACGPTGSTKSITVPAQDPTPPTVVLDLIFPQGQIFTVTPAGFASTLPTELNGGEEISLVARCTDTDGGCQNILISLDAMTTNSDGSSMRQVSTLSESPDPAAKPGGSALTERLVSAKLDIPRLRGVSEAVRLTVTSTAVNALGATDTTRQLMLFWSRKVPLVIPPCPRFSPVGVDPPMVLDSRELSVVILNLMNGNPQQMNFSISTLPPFTPEAYALKVTIALGAPGPSAALFRLENSIGETLQAQTVDSRNCGAAGQRMTALPNATTPFVNVDNTNTTTIVFSTVGDSVTPSRDIAVWNEIPFWQAFGGRTTTFQWIPKP